MGKIALKEDTPFERPERVRTPPDITRGSPESMELAVTFDGGSDGREAGEILKILRERSIKTTVFITGSFIKKYPGLVWMIVRDGHEVGNHTMNHPHLTSYAIDYTHTTLPGIDRELIARELKDTAVLFKEVTGVEMAPIWRAPYGEVNGEIRRWAFEQGYVHIGWTMNYSTKESLDSLDWVSDKSSELYLTSKEIKYKLLDFEKGGTGLRGGIILMHLGTKRNGDRLSDRLGEILDAISERGYRFVKVSTLIKGNKIKPFGKKHLASTRPWSPINRIRE